ncbi:MAG: nitroreductase family protein [Muribaculaceae bacterium]|nr:nitroreductase family protein [Muribaculaceae bacterium]MDE7368322.1 nitroreductase family protein [Muribaculaceae bacterium]
MDINRYWENRATVRRYTDRVVSDELLRDLMAKASHAPTTGNMQLYSVIVTRDAEMKRKLAPAHFNQPSVESASVVLTFCADYNRFSQWCRQRKAVPGYDNFQSFIAALLDTALLAQQFNTVAELAGLGCCYLGTTTYNAPQIAELLQLPKLVVPVTTLTVGYPDGESTPSDRLAPDAFLHSETYHSYTPEQIDRYYAEKEALPESAKFIAENNKETLAQVFTDIRYTKENNEYFSKIFADFIKQQGF